MNRENIKNPFGFIAPLILSSIIVSVVVGGGLYWKELQKQKELSRLASAKEKELQGLKQTIQTQIKTASSTADTSNWKTYRNEKYGFEVKYPPSAQVEELNKYIQEGIMRLNFGSCSIAFGTRPVGFEGGDVEVREDRVSINGKEVKRIYFLFSKGGGVASINLSYPANKDYPYYLIQHSVGSVCLSQTDSILSTFRFTK